MTAYRVEFDAHVSILVEAVSPEEAISIGIVEVDNMGGADLSVDAFDDDRTVTALDDDETGTCDTCERPYLLASRADRCGECGNCGNGCCTHAQEVSA